MKSIQPFRIDVPDETLERIRARVAGYPWHEMPDDGGWEYGANLDYMKELCAYWVEAFDWRKQEAAINRFSHFTAPVNSIDLHFIHEKGLLSQILRSISIQMRVNSVNYVVSYVGPTPALCAILRVT